MIYLSKRRSNTSLNRDVLLRVYILYVQSSILSVIVFSGLFSWEIPHFLYQYCYVTTGVRVLASFLLYCP